MTIQQKAIGILAAALTLGALGCATAPATQAPVTPTDEQATTVPPDQVLRGDRQLLVAGVPMSFEQIQAQLPETLTTAQAARMLVSLDARAVATAAESPYTIQQGYFFRRGYYGGFGGAYGGYRYYNYRGYYFPYSYYGGLYRRYNYNNYYPFFYNYGARYYPYYYNTCGGC